MRSARHERGCMRVYSLVEEQQVALAGIGMLGETSKERTWEHAYEMAQNYYVINRQSEHAIRYETSDGSR